MDAALMEIFLQLILTNYKADFKLVKNRNPIMLFMECYSF